MNNIQFEPIVYFTKNHTFAEFIRKLPFTKHLIEYWDQDLTQTISSKYDDEIQTIIFDLTLFEGKQKKAFFDRLYGAVNAPYYFLDTSLYWSEYYLERYPQISGVFSLAFNGIEQLKIESFIKEEATYPKEVYQIYKNFFEHLGRTLINVSRPTVSFTYPRVLAQLINEAHRLEEEGVADQKTIDMAMRFGVNHPKGPFQWSTDIGYEKIYWLLNELKNATGENRYDISRTLKLKALNQLETLS